MRPIFKDSSFKKRLFKLFVPLFLQELVVALTTLMSNLILNLWHCETAMTTGIAYVFQVFLLYNIVEASICQISILFMSQHYGRGDIASVQKDYYVTLKIAFAIGLLFFILALAIPEQIFFFDNDPNSKRYAIEYLRWFAPIFLLVGPSMINYATMRSTHLEKFCTISSILTFVIVLSIESISIFSLSKEQQDLALKLAAISMVVSRLIEFIFVFIVIKKKCIIKFKFKDFIKLDSDRFKMVIRYGLPLFLAKFSWGISLIFTIVFTGLYLPDEIITANSLMISYVNIVACISDAISFAIAVLIGRELGANRLRKAKDHASDISILLLIMGFIEMGFLIIFLPIVMATTAPETLQVAGDYLWKIFLIQLIPMIPRSYNSAYLKGLFNAGGDTLYIMLVDGIIAWVTIVPLAYIGLNFNWNPLLIYAIIQCLEVFKLPLNIWRYKQKKWANNITQKKGIVFNE